MKFALRAAFVVALAYIYLRLVYLSDRIDEALRSSVGQKVYVFLANLFDAQNADEGETLLLLVYFVIAPSGITAFSNSTSPPRRRVSQAKKPC